MAERFQFNEVEEEFITAFYVEHYDQFRASGYKNLGGSSSVQVRLYGEMTKATNAKFGKKYTQKQVRTKVKNMKRHIKQRLQEECDGIFTDDHPDLAIMTEAEAALVRFCSEELMRSAQLGEQAFDGDQEDDSDMESDGEGNVAERVVQPEIPVPFRFHSENRTVWHGHRPSTFATPTAHRPIPTAHNSSPASSAQRQFRTLPASRGLNRPEASAGQLRFRPAARPNQTFNSPQRQRLVNGHGALGDPSLITLEKSVLLLRKRALERDMRMKEEKEAAIEKFNTAINEFRRYVAEERLVSRGADISHIPIDIPPGMDALEHL